MATINYEMTVTTSETSGEVQAPLESATIKTLMEQIINQLNLGTGMAKITVSSLTEV